MNETENVITIEEFCKAELKVAVITQCDEIPKADKLWKLQIDLGTERRQILAGIKLHYKAEDLIGKSIVVLTNLPPRTMRGEISHGMLLAASCENQVVLVTVDSTIPAGSKIG